MQFKCIASSADDGKDPSTSNQRSKPPIHSNVFSFTLAHIHTPQGHHTAPRTFHRCKVLPLHVPGRVQQPLGQLPVPAEEEEARGVRVEAADGVEALLQPRGERVLEVGPAHGVAHGGMHAEGFVVGDEDGQRRDWLVVDKEDGGGRQVEGGVPGLGGWLVGLFEGGGGV